MHLINTPPLFIIGTPRSGTTLLTRLLNAHPNILLTHESAFFLLLDLLIKESRAGIEGSFFYPQDYKEIFSSYIHDRAHDLLVGFYERIAEHEQREDLSYWGDKHPHHDVCMDFLDELFPQARYIHILRDPRDSACSIAEMNKSSFQDALKIWKRIADGYANAMLFLDGSQCMSIRYEDFVRDYEGGLQSILEWLGVDAHEAVWRYLAKIRNKDIHRPDTITGKDFAAQAIGRWRRELSAEDRVWAMEYVGDYLERYGYGL
jgi:LPS sulfotransferase NodH